MSLKKRIERLEGRRTPACPECGRSPEEWRRAEIRYAEPGETPGGECCPRCGVLLRHLLDYDEIGSVAGDQFLIRKYVGIDVRNEV